MEGHVAKGPSVSLLLLTPHPPCPGKLGVHCAREAKVDLGSLCVQEALSLCISTLGTLQSPLGWLCASDPRNLG